jgi:hypothetical protein
VDVGGGRRIENRAISDEPKSKLEEDPVRLQRLNSNGLTFYHPRTFNQDYRITFLRIGTAGRCLTYVTRLKQ